MTLTDYINEFFIKIGIGELKTVEIMQLMVILIFLICFIISILSLLFSKKSQLYRYSQVSIGMTEDEMLDIMGGGYSLSSLKNNRKKYEWRANGSSFSVYGHGMSSRSYDGVSFVSIYVNNGTVEEIKVHNL